MKSQVCYQYLFFRVKRDCQDLFVLNQAMSASKTEVLAQILLFLNKVSGLHIILTSDNVENSWVV